MIGTLTTSRGEECNKNGHYAMLQKGMIASTEVLVVQVLKVYKSNVTFGVIVSAYRISGKLIP